MIYSALKACEKEQGRESEWAERGGNLHTNPETFAASGRNVSGDEDTDHEEEMDQHENKHWGEMRENGIVDIDEEARITRRRGRKSEEEVLKNGKGASLGAGNRINRAQGYGGGGGDGRGDGVYLEKHEQVGVSGGGPRTRVSSFRAALCRRTWLHRWPGLCECAVPGGLFNANAMTDPLNTT